MSETVRRVAAAAVVVGLAALVACDLWLQGVRVWWDRHSLTGSVVASLLVLAVTALIVDEVVARRQRRERAVSVAVQALIVYGQARRAWNAVMAEATTKASAGGASEELRTLAGMLLTASPSLFDDPEARRFLEEAERFSVSVYRMASKARGRPGHDGRDESALSRLQAAVKPLLGRIPSKDRALLEGPR